MYSSANVFLVCVLLNGLFKPHVSVPITLNEGNKIEGRECKLLEDCVFYQQFPTNNISESLKIAIKKELQRQVCGLDEFGDVHRVNCPIEKDEDVSNAIRGATELKVRDDYDESCGGSLKIVHAKENDLGSIQEINLGGTKTKYRNLKRGFPVLKTNVVLHVEAYGCFCWEMYDNPNYVGNKAEINPGDRQYLNIIPVSVKKVECPGTDYYDDEYYGD